MVTVLAIAFPSASPQHSAWHMVSVQETLAGAVMTPWEPHAHALPSFLLSDLRF